MKPFGKHFDRFSELYSGVIIIHTVQCTVYATRNCSGVLIWALLGGVTIT